MLCFPIPSLDELEQKSRKESIFQYVHLMFERDLVYLYFYSLSTLCMLRMGEKRETKKLGEQFHMISEVILENLISHGIPKVYSLYSNYW